MVTSHQESRLFAALTDRATIDWVPMSDDFDCATLTNNVLSSEEGKRQGTTPSSATTTTGACSKPNPVVTPEAAARLPGPTTPLYGRRSDRKEELDMMVAKFPAQAESIRAFYRRCDAASSNFGPYLMLLKLLPMRVARALERRLEAAYRPVTTCAASFDTPACTQWARP